MQTTCFLTMMAGQPFILLVVVLTLLVQVVAGDEAFAVNLLTLVPFTFDGSDHPYYGNEGRNNLGFSHMAAALLAMQHFNERNSDVVPELDNAEFAMDSCQLHFKNTSVIADTRGRGSDAVSAVLDQVANQNTLGAIVGAYHEEPALELSVLASSLEIPFVAYGGSNIRVVTPHYYPFSSRTSAGVVQVAEAAVSFLFHLGRTDAIGILQAASATAAQLTEGILASVTKRGASTKALTYVPPVFSGPERDVEDSMTRLKATGFRTFVLIVDTIEDELQLVADAANKLDVNNGDYVWLVMGDIELDFFASPTVIGNENIQKLLRGSGHVRALDRFTWDPDNDKFLASWKSQNSTFVQTVNRNNPIEPESPGFLYARDDYFQTSLPEPGAGFLYDAVMSIGLGLCRAHSVGDWSDWSVIASQQLTMFHGATGQVSFGGHPAYPGGRAAGTTTFGAFNILPQSNMNASYELASILPSGDASEVEWNDTRPFYFAGGTASPPELLQDPTEQIYLAPWARVIGFTLFGVAFIVIVGSVVWVYVYRNIRSVKAAQPEFLYVLCCGSLLIAVAIPLNSFDIVYTDVATLNRLCTATPWVVFMGIMIIYSALFTKLWRINSLLQFRRIKIKISHVMWPFALLFVAAIVVLSLWTVREGFEWVDVEVDPVSGARMGKCEGIRSVEFFTPIFLLTILPVLLTAVMAWKTRDIDKTYAESGWIAALIGVHLQVLVVAIPVLGILEGRSSNARYLGQVAVFFLYPVSTVGFVIGPKMCNHHCSKRKGPRRGSSTGQVRVSGISTVHFPAAATVRNSLSSGSDQSNSEHVRVVSFRTEVSNEKPTPVDAEMRTCESPQAATIESNDVSLQSGRRDDNEPGDGGFQV